MKKMKKVLALVLSVSLVFTMAVPSVVSADETETVSIGVTKVISGNSAAEKNAINYLAIGDAQPTGVLAKDAKIVNSNNENNGLDTDKELLLDALGFNVLVDNSYPYLFADELKSDAKQVNLYQYGVGSMTVKDLLTLLDVNSASAAKEAATFGDKICASYLPNWVITTIKPDYQKAVENANVITMDFGLNTVSSYLLAGLNGKRSDSASQQAIYDALYAAVMAKFADNTAIAGKLNSTENILGALVYAISAYTQDYIAAVAAIDKLNTAEGLQIYNIVSANAVTDLALQIKDDMLLNNITNPVLTGIVDTLFKAANSYIEKSCDKLGVDFTNVYPGDFGTVGDKAKAAESDGEDSTDPADEVANVIDTVIFAISVRLAESGTISENDKMKLLEVDTQRNSRYTFASEYSNLPGYQAIKDVIENELSNTATPLYLSNVAEMLKSGLESTVEKEKKATEGTEYEKIIAALESASNEAEIKAVFSKGDATATPATTDGVGYDFLKLCLNVVCAAGNVATVGADADADSGHKTIAAALESAYENSDTVDAQDVLKVAVPVIVGGVAVTLVTAAVVKAIKNKNSDQLSEDSELSYDTEAEAEASSPLASFMAKIESVMKQATSIFTSFFTKLKTGNTYEFSYVAPSTK